MPDLKIARIPDCPDAVLLKIAAATGATIERDDRLKLISIRLDGDRVLTAPNNTALLVEIVAALNLSLNNGARS